MEERKFEIGMKVAVMNSMYLGFDTIIKISEKTGKIKVGNNWYQSNGWAVGSGYNLPSLYFTNDEKVQKRLFKAKIIKLSDQILKLEYNKKNKIIFAKIKELLV